MNHAQDLCIDFKNLRKVKKALARCWATGKTLQELENALCHQANPFADLSKETFLVQVPIEILRWRIRQRAQTMLDNGLIEEVKGLLESKQLIPNTTAALAIGYRETIAYLSGEISREQLYEQIVQNTYALVKKQMTWFRYQIRFDHYLYL